MTSTPSPDALVDLARSNLRFNAPLSLQRADDLVRRVAPVEGDQALDLGCGDGELLLRLAHEGVHGLGVDLDPRAIERARARADERGASGRVRFRVGDVRAVHEQADVVVCVGAAHGWGGAAGALQALRERANDGARLLYGDGIWTQPPSREALAILGELPSLADLTDVAVDARWRPLHVATSTRAEHDDWESDWRAPLEREGSAAARALADERRTHYLRGYRETFGFAWLVLLAG